jgi:hypothetical protein
VYIYSFILFFSIHILRERNETQHNRTSIISFIYKGEYKGSQRIENDDKYNKKYKGYEICLIYYVNQPEEKIEFSLLMHEINVLTVKLLGLLRITCIVYNILNYIIL